MLKAKLNSKRKKKAAKAKDKKTYKKPANKLGNPPKRKPKSESKGTNPKPKVQKELVANEDFSEGTKVLVKFGSSPVSATILETSKDEVSVQLGFRYDYQSKQGQYLPSIGVDMQLVKQVFKVSVSGIYGVIGVCILQCLRQIIL